MKILSIFKTNDLRTKTAQKNIILLFVNKLLAVLVSFQLIPATIGYVDTSQYGVWIAISSIVSWMVYFDFGLTHGFRNSFAKAKAEGKIDLAKRYVSTSYFILTVIFLSIMVIGLIANYWLDWSSLLGVGRDLNPTLTKVFNLLVIFFSIQMILNLFTTLLLADQKPALSASLVTIGQLLSLITIYFISAFTKGSLINLALALVGIPVISLIIFTLLFFRTKFRKYSPSIKSIDLSLTKNIIGLGSKFFIIQLSMLFVFQFANFILIRIMGPESVTTYTIVYRYFSMIYVVMGIVFLPFWSAFTDAYTKGEINWMKTTYKKLSRIWMLVIPIFIILLFSSQLVYKFWLAKNIQIDFWLSFAMGIHMILLSRANLYMFCLNGIGKVNMQMLVYLVFAIISIPLMIYFTNLWGYYGVILVSGLVYLFQGIIGDIQLRKILNKCAYGIWNK
ncbi:lipopolysaccharide biosynthesis protein [Sphingobacterium kyonggiense]